MQGLRPRGGRRARALLLLLAALSAADDVPAECDDEKTWFARDHAELCCGEGRHLERPDACRGYQPEEERVPVGIIPAGSGNTWAYDLGVDDAAGAAALIARGETAAVDVLAVSPAGGTASSAPPPEQQVEYAVNICGFGMPAAVLEQANALRWLGSAQYELAGLLLILAGRCRPATRPGRASALDAELLLASAGLGGAAR